MYFIKDYAEIGIYCCFRICTIYEKFILFLKTTRKYALLSTPIESRAATRMNRWSNFNNCYVLLVKSSHEFHFVEWEKTENIKQVELRIPSLNKNIKLDVIFKVYNSAV